MGGEQGAERLDDGQQQDEEPPEDGEVGDTGRGPLQQLSLSGDLDELGPGDVAAPIEPTGLDRLGEAT